MPLRLRKEEAIELQTKEVEKAKAQPSQLGRDAGTPKRVSGAPREERVGEREIKAVTGKGQQEVLHYRNMFLKTV